VKFSIYCAESPTWQCPKFTSTRNQVSAIGKTKPTEDDIQEFQTRSVNVWRDYGVCTYIYSSQPKFIQIASMKKTSIWPYPLHLAEMLLTKEESKQLHKDLVPNAAPNYAIKAITVACFYISRKDQRAYNGGLLRWCRWKHHRFSRELVNQHHRI